MSSAAGGPARRGIVVGGFLLAGGRSSRMGQDKALLRLGDQTLAERGLGKLREVAGEVAMAGGSPGLMAFGRVVPDGRPECGPLGGIVAALEGSPFEWNVFIPVDVPFLPVAALRRLMNEAKEPALAYLSEAGGRVHPLCAVFSRDALPVLRGELDAGRLRVRAAAEATGRVCYVRFEEEAWFRNVNTCAEFEQAGRDEAEARARGDGPGIR